MFYPGCKVFLVKEADLEKFHRNYLFDNYCLVTVAGLPEFEMGVQVNDSKKYEWDGKERIEKGDMAVQRLPSGGLFVYQIQKRRCEQFGKEVVNTSKLKEMRIH